RLRSSLVTNGRKSANNSSRFVASAVNDSGNCYTVHDKCQFHSPFCSQQPISATTTSCIDDNSNKEGKATHKVKFWHVSV
ncbi:hypothetical protein A2U01_0078231, partial [Trifolium medium]|nr:hypothetical protein [Trifolium medium]